MWRANDRPGEERNRSENAGQQHDLISYFSLVHKEHKKRREDEYGAPENLGNADFWHVGAYGVSSFPNDSYAAGKITAASAESWCLDQIIHPHAPTSS